MRSPLLFPSLTSPFRQLRLTSLFTFLLISVISSFGQSFTQEAQGFNVFVQQSFTFGGGDLEGAAAMGGNLVLQGNQGQFSIQEASAYMAPGMSAGLGLLVGNQVQLNGGGLNILTGAKVIIGNSTGIQALDRDQNNAQVNTRIVSDPGTYSSTPKIELNHRQSESIFQPSPIDFAFAFSAFQARSTNVAALSTNMTIAQANGTGINPSSIPNNSQIYVHSLSAGANILNLTGTNLNKISSITFNAKPSASQYVIINVDKPGTFNWNNFNFTGVSSTDAQYILLNFSNTTTLNINSASTIFGTVFAPFAAVSKNNSANIDGQVIAQSFNMTQGGEIHKMYFLSADPSATSFPVEWAGFEARWEAGAAVLEWATASELNASHFEVERSTDLVMFERIGSIAAEGNSTEVNQYRFDDRSAASLPSRSIYYRLRQTDLNGQFSFSDVVEVHMGNANSQVQLTLFPNPASDKVHVTWSGSQPINLIRLTDMTGRELQTMTVSQGDLSAEMSLQALPAGQYQIILSGPSTITGRTVVVQ